MNNNILDSPIDKFYSKKLYFSYSALKKLMWNPKAYYDYYILENKEDKISDNLIKGKVIHCLLLNNQDFNDLFIVSPANLPTGNNKLIVDRVFYHHKELVQTEDSLGETIRLSYKLSDYSNAILDILVDINLHQSLKTDQQRLDKLLTEENINYFEFLKTKQGKTLLDQETYDYCKSAAEILKNNEIINDLLGLNAANNLDDSIEVYNEVELRAEILNHPFGLKGILDNIKVDHNKKIIYINDLKTTSKGIVDFKESVEFWDYWMQAAIYTVLVIRKFEGLIFNNVNPYQVEFRFIVIDNFNQVYPFLVQTKTLDSWYSRLEETLKKANYHYTEKKYNLPYDFDRNLVEL